MTCPHGIEPSECLSCATIRDRRLDDPQATSTRPPATQIDRFLVLEKLGEGGMGVVYSAFDPALDRRVAIKVIRPELGDEASSVLRLQREAQAMAKLSHPNVVPVYDVGNLGSSIFVAMEYVTGATLAEWMKDEPRRWSDTLALFVQAGRGLEAAHAAGIIHRDFKPSNVLLGKDGRARVSDFGLAREEGAGPPTLAPTTDGSRPPAKDSSNPLTGSGVIVGSLGYMAPEQYRGERVTAAADQYSFCVALYEGLYGRRPFRGDDLRTFAALAESGEVPKPPKGSAVPDWLFAVVLKGLDPDPGKRHSSMTALLALLEDDPVARRRRRLVASGAVFLVVAAIAGLLAAPRLQVSSCERAGDRFADSWAPGLQADTKAAFVATGLPYAGTSWEQTRSRLDRFATEWVGERSRACRETLSEGFRTKRQLELRLRCLDQRRAEFETLTARLLHADAKLVEQSVVASARLTPVGRCADLEGLEARAQLRPDAHRAVELIELQLAQGRILVALGRYDDAGSVLQGAMIQARELGDAQALGMVALELGVLQRYQQKFAESRATLQEALRKSLEGRDDRTALEAIGRMVSLVGWRLEKPAEALSLADVGFGLVPRVADPGLEALLFEGQGDAFFQGGEARRSLEAYERALQAIERAEPSSPIEAARLRASIGFQEMEFGHVTRAIEFYRRAKQDREIALGSGHPFLTLSYGDLASASEALDDLEAAREGFDQERKGLEQQGKTGVPIIVSRLNLARVLSKLGRGDEALALIATVEADLKPEHLTGIRLELGQVKGNALWAAKRLVEAERLVSETLRQALEHFGPGYTENAEIRYLLGRILADERRPAEAIAQLELALEQHVATKDLESIQYAGVLVELAAARSALAPKVGWATALDLAERGAKAASALEGNARLKAKGHLVLAEARWQSGKRAEAVEAARQAVVLAGTLEQAAEKARAWLAAHPLPN